MNDYNSTYKQTFNREYSTTFLVSNDIVNVFLQVAMADGVVTEEEKSLIAIILSNVENYEKFLDIALEDNVITEDEKNQLFRERLHILESSYLHAMNDRKITEDERKLLHTMQQLLNQFREHELANFQ